MSFPAPTAWCPEPCRAIDRGPRTDPHAGNCTGHPDGRRSGDADSPGGGPLGHLGGHGGRWSQPSRRHLLGDGHRQALALRRVLPTGAPGPRRGTRGRHRRPLARSGPGHQSMGFRARPEPRRPRRRAVTRHHPARRAPAPVSQSETLSEPERDHPGRSSPVNGGCGGRMARRDPTGAARPRLVSGAEPASGVLDWVRGRPVAGWISR